jgi:potassium-transporting ATPase potassium-binding subunit
MWLFPSIVLVTSVFLSFPAGWWLARVLDSQRPRIGLLRWIEDQMDTGPQSARQYVTSLLVFNTLLFVVGFATLALQPMLPLNPENKGMLAPTTILHTTISFFTNNSLQHYSGEQHLSYFSQLTVIVGNMFLGGGVSVCALVAVIRGLRGDPCLGNFYVDMGRSIAYVFVPVAFVVGLAQIAAGTPMTFAASADVNCLQGESQLVARGPVAALVPIKNLASVGGGFFGANSAHPFENPGAATNFLQCVCILLFPCAVIVMFGIMLRRMRHALILYGAMVALFCGLMASTIAADSLAPNAATGARHTSAEVVAVIASCDLAELPVAADANGNLEGKELRFGRAGSSTFAATTTAVACGSVNCMHDSLNPLAGLPLLTGMWLNCVFGGKGVGLLNFLVFVIVAVFLTGLMVGRTPEYLGKKVEAREMKLAMLAFLIHPLMILVPAALFAVTPWGRGAISNPGPHGLTQIIYEFSSASAGNGSDLQGLGNTWGLNDPDQDANPPAPYSVEWDIATSIVMLVSRFVPIIAAILLAGSLAAKTATPFTVGTLRTDTVTFGVVLLAFILVLGALVFLPAAALGPVAEHFGPIPFGG